MENKLSIYSLILFKHLFANIVTLRIAICLELSQCCFSVLPCNAHSHCDRGNFTMNATYSSIKRFNVTKWIKILKINNQIHMPCFHGPRSTCTIRGPAEYLDNFADLIPRERLGPQPAPRRWHAVDCRIVTLIYKIICYFSTIPSTNYFYRQVRRPGGRCYTVPGRPGRAGRRGRGRPSPAGSRPVSC